MKKILSISTLIIALAFFANTDSFAQEGEFSAGAGLAYATQDVGIGIQATGVYGITESIRGAADFTYFFGDEQNFGGVTVETTYWELNANAHYVFLNDGATVYGLAGLNYLSANASVSGGGFGGFGTAGGGSEIGLNLGGGVEFDMDFANLYAELKYTIGNADKLGLAAGLRFPF